MACCIRTTSIPPKLHAPSCTQAHGAYVGERVGEWVGVSVGDGVGVDVGAGVAPSILSNATFSVVDCGYAAPE